MNSSSAVFHNAIKVPDQNNTEVRLLFAVYSKLLQCPIFWVNINHETDKSVLKQKTLSSKEKVLMIQCS